MNPPERTHLTRPSEVKSLLVELDFHPSRVLGQNFLIDANILDLIMEMANLRKTDRVLEVGPGLGVLTERLLEAAGEVIAVEKDRRLCAFLRKRFADAAHLELIEGDALEQNLPALLRDSGTPLVANLPYSVASRLLVELLLGDPRPGRMVVTLQKEVVDRLAAPPGSGTYGMLGILVQLRYRIVRRKPISRTCFYPPPEIASALVALEAHVVQPDVDLYRRAFRFIKECFHHRRKQMATLIKRRSPENPDLLMDKLRALGYRPESRPEEIRPEDWLELVR